MIKGRVTNIPALKDIGMKYDKTAAQVALRWEVQNGIVTIPKTSKKERMIENSSIFDFQLKPEDMERIEILDRDLRTGPDPSNIGT